MTPIDPYTESQSGLGNQGLRYRTPVSVEGVGVDGDGPRRVDFLSLSTPTKTTSTSTCLRDPHGPSVEEGLSLVSQPNRSPCSPTGSTSGGNTSPWGFRPTQVTDLSRPIRTPSPPLPTPSTPVLMLLSPLRGRFVCVCVCTCVLVYVRVWKALEGPLFPDRLGPQRHRSGHR